MKKEKTMSASLEADADLNRAVAEARGWTEINMGGAGMAWELPNGAIRALPNICTDPAAWGALFIELSDLGMEPEICGQGKAMGKEAYYVLMYEWRAKPGQPRAVIEAYDGTSPGRALALAFLASRA